MGGIAKMHCLSEGLRGGAVLGQPCSPSYSATMYVGQ